MEDTTLVTRAKKGDRNAIASLVERHEKEIFYFIYKMTRNIDDAKDLTQEVFLKAFKKIAGFSGKSAFRTWLYRIATNHTINFLTRRPPTASEIPFSHLPDPSPTSGERIEKAEMNYYVHRAIEKLPKQQKAIVTLRAQEGMTYAEIAEILGCSIGNCKATYHNAIIKLREILKHEAIL